MVRYYDSLLKLPNTHPAVFQDFKNGLFAVKRTNKLFPRSPIDLTLKQTINADGACQRRSTITLPNSISARQRWAQSHTLRTSITSHLFESVGISKKEYTSDDLKRSKTKNNSEDVQQIITAIEGTMDPSSADLDKNELFNISSGRAVTQEISASLLKVREIGETARLGFIKECNEDPLRFEKPIKRCNIKTFQDATKKYKVRGQNEKTEAVAMVRHLFSSVLFLSLQRKVDMAEVFCYPLTPVPLSLCHTDGTILNSPKAKLLTELESRVKSEAPTKIDATVVDGMFFLHL